MQFKSKQTIGIVLVIAIGVVLALLIVRGKTKDMGDSHDHGVHTQEKKVAAVDNQAKHGEAGHKHEKDHPPSAANAHDEDHLPQADEIPKGPHGGKLFSQDGYAVEVTIFEQNTPPEFRIYTYQDGKPLKPADSTISVELDRLGKNTQQISFVSEGDYLKGNAIVEEPHSFEVNITANYNKKSYQFDYEQVEARVKLSDKQVTQNGVEVLTAGPAKIKSMLNLQGEIKLNADKTVHIVPRVGGMVESVSANAGDKVRKGQVLASISSQSIADMRSDLLAAQKKVGFARATYNREKQLWEEKISAQQDYLQAQHDLQEAEINAARIQQKMEAIGAGSTGKGLARYEIRSPIDGVVTNKQISQGQVVKETDDLFEIADLSTVWAQMTIYAKDIGAVKAGQKVTIKAIAFDAQAVGTIAYVGAIVGEQSRAATARVVLANPNKNWLPGLPVNVELISNEINVPLAVSVEGLQSLRDGTVVFGRYGEYFEARPLELGRRDDKYVEVLQGLNVGEKYAAGNSFLIKADIGKAGASHDH
jgi:membrane fusion protein, heavy metal efflux system